MNATNDCIRLVDDLAGDWTDPALELLKASGVPAVSVDMELETWKTLKQVLRTELRQQPSVQHRTPVSVNAVKGKVLQTATRLVAQKFAPIGR